MLYRNASSAISLICMIYFKADSSGNIGPWSVLSARLMSCVPDGVRLCTLPGLAHDRRMRAAYLAVPLVAHMYVLIG